jgi:hypothetical protein
VRSVLVEEGKTADEGPIGELGRRTFSLARRHKRSGAFDAFG